MTGARDRWLAIVGIGEDGLDGLSPAARALVSQAVLVVGGARHIALAGSAIRGETLAWPSPLVDAFPAILARRGQPVCVLASGDPFFYGVGNTLMRLVDPAEVICLPAPSAFSLATARLGWPLQDCSLVSLHGRSFERIVPHLQPCARIVALSWDGTTPKRLARELVDRGMGASRLVVLEAMGGPAERIIDATAETYEAGDVAALNTVAIEVLAGRDARVLPLAAGLPDALFETDGQLTKREIRAVTLSALAPRRGELLWDVGAGSGSVGIEWMLRHPMNRTIAVEPRSDRAARVARNAMALGVPDLDIVCGEAPDALAGLPVPDAVFIGGGATDAGVLDAAWAALRPGGRFVANAVTLETQAVLLERFARHGGEMVTIAVSRADKVGPMHGWRAAMPVTQWAVTKPEGGA
ncbi:precorrin-6y C5,15-methyltransferase (decarboxylating) subunit CbiE [uncultured Alsobacter sp.]|uniref:precorrin-6y C5,15-methyltransferase (decarboxylating) subunit CbiE n=1 Tax=uncultured Alsobacter sp. TaxID=1748258 RepID=UPI0025D3AB22|nr:precorrin-6y C5,15-methyltransferase (decarboxylating) subunit CbiE [uncultured Alsobacter sp.]